MDAMNELPMTPDRYFHQLERFLLAASYLDLPEKSVVHSTPC